MALKEKKSKNILYWWLSQLKRFPTPDLEDAVTLTEVGNVGLHSLCISETWRMDFQE